MDSVSSCSPPQCVPQGLEELIYSTVWGNWILLFVHNHICVDSYWELSTRFSEEEPKLINNHIDIFGRQLFAGVCSPVFNKTVQFLYRKQTSGKEFT